MGQWYHSTLVVTLLLSSLPFSLQQNTTTNEDVSSDVGGDNPFEHTSTSARSVENVLIIAGVSIAGLLLAIGIAIAWAIHSKKKKLRKEQEFVESTALPARTPRYYVNDDCSISITDPDGEDVGRGNWFSLWKSDNSPTQFYISNSGGQDSSNSFSPKENQTTAVGIKEAIKDGVVCVDGKDKEDTTNNNLFEELLFEALSQKDRPPSKDTIFTFFRNKGQDENASNKDMMLKVEGFKGYLVKRISSLGDDDDDGYTKKNLVGLLEDLNDKNHNVTTTNDLVLGEKVLVDDSIV